MTPEEFIRKWERYRGKETSGYQEHFNDLCRLLGQKTPVEADPSGEEWFCFQKGVVKDLELHKAGDKQSKGFADVWRKDCFGWEYKGKHKNLADAHKQLLRYRESLLNPPLLVTCDFDRFILKTNFNGTVVVEHQFTNTELAEPKNLRLLRDLFEHPERLKPTVTTAEVTEKLAEEIAKVARSLQSREAVELADARNRREVTFAQKKNLRIARFLNRIVFCLFAEDTNLLPEKLLHSILETSYRDPSYFAPALESLFRAMATGGLYGPHQIRHFNGHLFEDTTVFELKPEEIKQLVEAAESSWSSIQPSIMGTLFERALEPEQRTQLGAHYTSEEDILTLLEPVVMAPLRREWKSIETLLAAARKKNRATKSERSVLTEFQKKLASITVLDPACGSGNFLYLSLRLLLDLEKEVVTFAAQLGILLPLKVDVLQLRALEINPYAFELAQVSVQIGALQWRRDNGYDNERTPVLRTLDGFENKDALLRETFRKQPKTLKEARAEEHSRQEELFRVFHERAWPDADFIVGNPPFLGDKKMRGELGDVYVEALRDSFSDRLGGQTDLCCYWFEKARFLVETGKCKRAGLLATQGIRFASNRRVLQRIKDTGDIFFAVSDRPWVLNGANVQISMVGFDNGTEVERELDGKKVTVIHADLKGGSNSKADVTQAKPLLANDGWCYLGVMKAGDFNMDEEAALEILAAPNASGQPNSDVLRPRWTARDLLNRTGGDWIIDFGVDTPMEAIVGYEKPFEHVEKHVKKKRDKNRRERMKDEWWLHGEARPGLRKSLKGLSRFILTPEISKHRVFAWADSAVLADHKTRAFGSNEDWFFGILHSRIHELWARAVGTQLRESESGFTYTPSTCFETFPFPFRLPTGTSNPREKASEKHLTAIGVAARELNTLRERWLNPPEWTRTEYLEFPASEGGPWDRFITPTTVKDGIGRARYPRFVPNDSAAAAALKGRSLTALYNERPAWLDLAHRKLDAVVAAAYGWPADQSDEKVLEELLKLNRSRADAEASIVNAVTLVQGPKFPQREKAADDLI